MECDGTDDLHNTEMLGAMKSSKNFCDLLENFERREGIQLTCCLIICYTCNLDSQPSFLFSGFVVNSNFAE